MKESTRSHARRILAEGTAIVVSILLAFAIQAWWDDRQEAAEARRLLYAVIEDVRQDQAWVARMSAYNQAVIESSRRLLELAGTGREPESQEKMDSLVADLSWWIGSDHWNTGAVQVLTSGGRLDLIRNEELRIQLASWESFIAGLRETEDQEYDFFVTTWLPFLRANTSLPQLGEVAQRVPGTGTEGGYGRMDFASIPTDHRPLLRSVEFRNLLVQKLWLQSDKLRAHGQFNRRAASLVELVEAESEELGGMVHR